MTTKFFKKFNKQELKDELNAQKIWEVLKSTQRQIIEPFINEILLTKKDKAGLITTNVLANEIETNFVFDTGAGISCITESIAKKMDLTILPDNNI